MPKKTQKQIESESMKEREYKEEKGEVHRHTKKKDKDVKPKDAD